MRTAVSQLGVRSRIHAGADLSNPVAIRTSKPSMTIRILACHACRPPGIPFNQAQFDAIRADGNRVAGVIRAAATKDFMRSPNG